MANADGQQGDAAPGRVESHRASLHNHAPFGRMAHNDSRNISLANTSQARKRARQSEQRRAQNASIRSAMRTKVKNTVNAIQAGDKAAAEAAYKAAVPALDKVSSKNLIGANKAARHKSRLNTRIKAMG